MSTTRVRRMHVSFIWSETFSALLSTDARNAPMAFLGQRQKYAAAFEHALSFADALTPPWVPNTATDYNRFWFHYLGNKPTDKIKGDWAWQRVVPFHTPIDYRVDFTEPTGRLILDGFYFSHGIAFVLTLVIESSAQQILTLDDAVTLAARARNEAMYDTQLRKDVKLFRQDRLAALALDDLRRRAIGAHATQGTRSSKPFTIATLITADTDDPKSLQPVEGNDINLALQGLCTLHPTWKVETPPPPLKDHTIYTRFAPADLLYGHERSRAMWFPTMFLESKRKIHTLSCYHRNLTMLSLQTEMLCGLVQLFAEKLEGSDLIPPALHNLNENAVVALTGLYGAAHDTYQSWSARRQIEHSGILDTLDPVREYFGLKKLAR